MPGLGLQFVFRTSQKVNVQKLCTQFNVCYLHHMTIWDVYFKVCKVANMSVSMSKLSFYTDVNPCVTRKKTSH